MEENPIADTKTHSAEEMYDEREWSRVTLGSIGDGVITTDINGAVTFLNSVAEELTGWTNEEAIGVKLTTVFHIVNEDTRNQVENPALHALKHGIIVGLANHTILITRDGREFPIDDSASPIRNTNGEVIGVVLVFRDVTERRATERELRASEIRYRRLFQTAKDGIIIIDSATGSVIDGNSFICSMLGLEPHKLIGKQLHEIHLVPDSDSTTRALNELQTLDYAHWEIQVNNPQGEVLDLDIVGNTYIEKERQVAQLNIRDISLRIKMEREIIRQSETIAEQSRRKDEFLAMLSHELRNPLAPIRSALYLLKLHEKGENQLQQQAREIIDRQVGNLTKMVGDLLEVSRVISGRIHLELATVDMNQIITHALQTVGPLIDRHKHTVKAVLSNEPIWVNVDPTRLEEVLTNILSNAAKYTPDGGTIALNCGREGSEAIVRIRDSGIGISSEVMPRIFELFSQAERSLDRSEGGLGIGLNLAHRLVNLHGGEIEAFSPPEGQNSGSEFRVRIPLVPAPNGNSVDLHDEKKHEPTGTRVLVVDDNVDHVSVLNHVLRQKGYNVQYSNNGADGFEIAKEWKPDIALLDIGLPGMDGRELARRLRNEPSLGANAKSMRLIAISGYSQKTDVELSIAAGFDAHITKPFNFDELLHQMSDRNS